MSECYEPSCFTYLSKRSPPGVLVASIHDSQNSWEAFVHWSVLALNRPRSLECPSPSPEFRCGIPPLPEKARKEREPPAQLYLLVARPAQDYIEISDVRVDFDIIMMAW